MKPLGFTLDEMRTLLASLDVLDDPSTGAAARREAETFVADCHARAEESCQTLRRQLAYAEEFRDLLALRDPDLDLAGRYLADAVVASAREAGVTVLEQEAHSGQPIERLASLVALTDFAATDLAAPATRGRDLSLVVWSTTVGAVIGPNLAEPGETVGRALGLPAFSGVFVSRSRPSCWPRWRTRCSCGPTR